ncbi:MAG TPA: flippase activity-associated protein Agl23 [Candidatus Angelobacter sp.]|nr:flippase activity-associated protein Agl23 [Candidatus Angelobacter sp.]
MKQVSAKGRQRKARIDRSEIAPSRALVQQPRDAWWWSGLAILIGAALLRLLFLTEKPLHHDEGVNGVFLATLFRTGFYHYDPANYHGPSLYYLAVIPTAINNVFHWGHGLSTFVIRLVTAAFGIGVAWLFLCLRRWLGRAGSLAAAALAAVSPGFVFFSRYFIHEILFVFFTLGIIVAWLLYRETGRQRYLMLASASAAMLFTTKETWIITTAVWLIAIPCTILYLRLRRRAPGAERQDAIPAAGNGRKQWLWAGLLFVAIGVLLYTSFFTNPRGILDAFRTFTYWFKTGEHGIYNREWSTYFQWMWQVESPILLLGGAGTLLALARARSRLPVFCAFWAIGIFAAYSLVPYKTPWLILSLILPLTLMAGYLIEDVFRAGARGGLTFVLGLLVFLAMTVGVLFSFYQAVDLSFVHYDANNESYPYVYAHTDRDFLRLVNEIETIAADHPAKNKIGITVMSPEHWPLPWYLRDYPNVGYWGKIVDTSEPLVIALEPQAPEVERRLGKNYRRLSTHELRPGNKLVMFVRNDLRF